MNASVKIWFGQFKSRWQRGVTPALILFGGLLIRWWWAATIPLGNDEAYYWDWARDLQQSYLDHPPGVAWVGLPSRWFGISGTLGARAAIPLMHLLGSLVLLQVARLLAGGPLTSVQLAVWLLTTQLTPVLNLGGFFLMPDSGLLLCLSGCAWIGVKAITRRRKLRLAEGLLYGAFWGLAGDFKYMALPLFMGGTAALWIARSGHRRGDVLFWLGVLASGLAVIWPVVDWNMQHAWASFRFQINHGFGSSSFSFGPAMRFAFGVLVMVSPWMAMQVVSAFLRTMGWPRAIAGLRDSRSARREGGLYLCWSFVALASLLIYQSFWKQLLPHWMIPAIWMVLPLVIVEGGSALRGLKGGFVFYSAVFVVAALFLGTVSGRQSLLEWTKEKPGALAELTLWEPLVSEARLQLSEVVIAERPRSALDCAGGQVVLAAPRWYWVAHLAFSWPGQPEVISLDLNAPSYYHQRNDLRQLEGCEVIVLGDDRHIDDQQMNQLIDVESRSRLEIPGHKDVAVSLIRGRLRATRAFGEYPLVGGI